MLKSTHTNGTHLVVEEETDGGRHGLVYFLDEAERDLSYMEMDGKMGLGQTPIRVRSTTSSGLDDQAQAAQYYNYYYGQYGGDQVLRLLYDTKFWQVAILLDIRIWQIIFWRVLFCHTALSLVS